MGLMGEARRGGGGTQGKGGRGVSLRPKNPVKYMQELFIWLPCLKQETSFNDSGSFCFAYNQLGNYLNCDHTKLHNRRLRAKRGERGISPLLSRLIIA